MTFCEGAHCNVDIVRLFMNLCVHLVVAVVIYYVGTVDLVWCVCKTVDLVWCVCKTACVGLGWVDRLFSD